MKIEETRVRKVRLSELEQLDPIDIILEDIELGKGKITIERTIREVLAPISDNLSWKMTGELKEEVVQLRIEKINWALTESHGLTLSNSREVTFERSVSTSYGGGVNFGAIETALSEEVSRANGAKFEQLEEESRTVNLDGQRCKAWFLKRVRISEYGEVSAPSLDITDKLNFTVIRGSFFKAMPLCYEDSGSNEPDSLLVAQAQLEIAAFEAEQEAKLKQKQK